MPKPLNTEALDRALNNINKAAEAAKTASASAVKKKKDENLYAQAARPAENRPPYADAAARRSYFGMGDTALSADQGRELLYSAQKASEERLARATAQIEEQARQARELREQSRKASEERLKRAREQIEAQARQAQETPAQREAPKNVSYTQENIDRGNRAYARRQAQQEQASAGFRANAMDMMGAALAAQETPYGAAAEQGRQVMDLYARAAESQRQSKELARAEDWEGREDMIARYRDLQRRVQETETMVGMGFGTPEDYEAQVRELEALRTELERRDTLAGNGARSYSGEDRVGNALTGTGQNIAAGIVNAGATAGEGYAREEALRENIAPSDYVLQQMAKGDLTEWNAMRQRTVDQEAIHEQFLPVYQAADSLSENAQRDLQKAKEGLGALGQAGVDIAENMMEMGFDAAVGAVSGGGSLTSMFVRVFGQSAQEARQNGATLEQQLAYGLTSAGIEILTEKIADGVAGIYGAGAADDITEELIRKLAETDTGRSALRLLIAGISEGGEEVVSDLLSPIAQAMYRTDEMGNRLTVGQLYGEIDPADVLHSFIIGAAVGWLSSAGGAVTGSNAALNAELRLRDALEPMAQQAAKSAETRAAWEAATGEKLSKNEGRAARQMLDYEAERVGSGEAGVLEGLLEKKSAPAEENRGGKASVDMSAQERIATVREMQKNGIPQSEIFNKTGLVVLANGTIQDGIGGPILSTGGNTNDQGTNAGSNPGILQGAERTAGETGGGGEGNQRLLRPKRRWTDLPEQNRAAAAETVRRRIESADSEELQALRRAFGKSDADPEAEIARRIYQDMQQDPIVAENIWGSLFNDIEGLLEELSQEGGANEQQSFGQGQENGDDGIRAGGEDGGILQESPGGRASVAGGEGQVRQSLGEGNAEDLREVTPAALGITGGDGSRTVQVRGENSYSEQERAAADMVRRAGMTPTIFSGEMLVNGESVNGWIENGQVYVRSDAVDAQGNPIPPESIAWHETFHDAAENDPGLVERGMSIIRENYDEARVQAMKDDYRETYKNIYDFETMTEDEIQKAIETELVGDAGAKLNRFSGDAETRQKIREAMPQVGESQQTQGQERATGPPKAAAGVTGGSTAPTTTITENVTDLPNGRKAVVIQTGSSILNGVRKGKWAETIANHIRNTLVGRIIETESGDLIRVTDRAPGEVTHGSNINQMYADAKITGDYSEIDTKYRAAEKTAAIIALSKYSRWSDNVKGAKAGDPFFKDGFNYRDAYFYIDGRLYVGTVITALNFDEADSHNFGEKFYDIVDIKLSPVGSTHVRGGTTGASGPHIIKIRADTTGDKITVAQQQRFVNKGGATYSTGDTAGNTKVKEAMEAAAAKRKNRQWEIIQKANPMRDDIHTGIRGVEEIRTFEEALEDDGIGEGDAGMAPDITADIIENAKKTGEITVYSSKPIQAGSFVTPSAMEARSYAGDGPIYSDTISTDDVAWIDSIQGQYAPAKGRGHASVNVSAERTAAEDTAAGASGELETRESVEEAKADLLEVGEGKVKNDTGEYRMIVRQKRDGHYLAAVERNGRRINAKTYATVAEAAEWAAGTVDGQTRWQMDAEMDRHKSEKKKGPTLTQQLFGQFDPEAEAKRQKENRAAEAATQTLRSRVKNTQEEINALNRLERTTGLTEAQRSHRADLQQTLEIMNDELESRKKKRGEAKAGERVEVKGNKPTQSVADARRTIMDLFHTPEGVRQEAGAAIQKRLEAMLRDGRVDEQSKQTLFGALMEAGMVPKAADPTFRQIREDLNGTRIYVNEQERADIGDNWKDLYQKAWGARIFLTSDPTDVKIDAVNGQMAETYGESMFPADAALSDMLENLIDKASRGRDSQQKLTDAIEDEARYTDTDIDEIYEDMYNRLDSELRTFAEKAGLEVALKNKAAGDMATERKRWEDRMERKAQERRESKIREKVLKGLQKLERLRGKSAPEVRAQIDEVLKDIDTQARSLTPYGIENLQALREVYEEKARQEGFVDDENPGNFIRNPYVEEKIGRLEKMHLNEMDIADVIELGNTVAGLVRAVQTANQMIGEEFDAGVKETAEGWDSEIRASRGAKPGSFVQEWFTEESLSPRRFLESLGGWKQGGIGQKLAKSLEDGQTRMLDFQRRAIQSFDPFMSKAENKKWLKTASGKNAKWSTYSVVNGMDMEGKSGYTGQSIEITPMMKIAIYLHSLNNDNLRHIQNGGLVIPDKALYQKGKIKEAYEHGHKVKMQPEAVRAIASTLTPEEKTFAGYLQKFFNEQSKAAINEVSMQLDGFERAAVENYFPIESSENYLKSDVAGKARAQTVEGIGSIANERVHSGNPIVLSDAYDVLTRQIDKVSRYYGYAIPIRNFQAVNNYVFHEEGNAFAGSIKEHMTDKWGGGAQEYITKMLEDIQGGGASTKNNWMTRGLAELRGNLAGATLSVNPSVAVSQTASYPGAAQVVGWDGLVVGLNLFHKVDEKLVEKYTPLLWYRSQGYSTQELGDAKAAANKTLGQKALSSKVVNWIQGMDRATVKRLWAAAEYRVTKDTGMKPGSKAQIDAGTDPYYKAVAEVFNRAVYDTQPNYTNMERAQILRSNDELTKFLTMYKTVPLQYYGMMYEAMGRLRAAQNGTEAEQKAARKYAADTVSGLIAANTLYVAVKAAFKGLRRKDDDYRDDEGELTAGSVTKQLGKDLLETTAGSIIGGAEAYSIIDGWIHGKAFNVPEISSLSFVGDLINAFGNIFKAIDADDPRKTAGAVKTAAETLATGTGMPVKNAETYLTALIGWKWPKVAMEYNNLFGGIDKSDIKKLDDDTVGMAANIIMRNRTGVQLDRAATDELSRLYKAGYNTAIPTEIPESFSYGGNEVKIKDRGAYGDTWGGVVGDNLEELLTSDSYEKANDKTKAAMVNHLYQYATVQARMGADPEYSAEGNSTYGWTVKADEAVEAGIDLSDAIGALVTMNGMTADKEAGRTVVSKKSKVVDYIDGLDLDEEQKDLLYEMAGYTSGLEYAPWHTGISAEAGYTSGTGPKVHEGTKKEVIAQYSDALTGSAAYKAADDQTKKAMVKLLQDYATAQGMKKTDPSWTPAGTEYNWTTWADTAVKAGIELPAAIAAKIELGKMKADYDDYGKAITGSKKEKVCAYIDALDLTPEQKDVLYLSVYNENSLRYTPWHGYEKKSGSRRGGSGRRRGGRSGRRTSSGSSKISAVSARPRRSTGGGIDASKLFGVKSPGKLGGDASRELLEIIDRYYGGDAWAAAMDGGRAAKGKTKVDFKL